MVTSTMEEPKMKLVFRPNQIPTRSDELQVYQTAQKIRGEVRRLGHQIAEIDNRPGVDLNGSKDSVAFVGQEISTEFSKTTTSDGGARFERGELKSLKVSSPGESETGEVRYERFRDGSSASFAKIDGQNFLVNESKNGVLTVTDFTVGGEVAMKASRPKPLGQRAKGWLKQGVALAWGATLGAIPVVGFLEGQEAASRRPKGLEAVGPAANLLGSLTAVTATGLAAIGAPLVVAGGLAAVAAVGLGTSAVNVAAAYNRHYRKATTSPYSVR